MCWPILSLSNGSCETAPALQTCFDQLCIYRERVRTPVNVIGDCFASKCIERLVVGKGKLSDDDKQIELAVENASMENQLKFESSNL